MGSAVYLSQSDYDALSEEEKNSDTVYYIIDSEGMGIVNDFASGIRYTNTNSELNATNVQEAIDEIVKSKSIKTAIDISTYTQSNPYTLPSDGYVSIKSLTSNAEVVGHVYNSEPNEALMAVVYPNRASIWLPKGTKIYHTNTENSTTPGTYSKVEFLALE